MHRNVPHPPPLARLQRRLARLPAGGPTGLACAVAGVACAAGMLVVRPNLDLDIPFLRDGPSDAGSAHSGASPAPSKTRSSSGSDARLTVAIGKTKPATAGSGAGSPVGDGAPGDASGPSPEPGEAQPTPAPTPLETSEPAEPAGADGTGHEDAEHEYAGHDDGHDGEHWDGHDGEDAEPATEPEPMPEP